MQRLRLSARLSGMYMRKTTAGEIGEQKTDRTVGGRSGKKSTKQEREATDFAKIIRNIKKERSKI